MKETFYIRNGEADIPAFVFGNGSSKVFMVVLHGGPGGDGLGYRNEYYADVLEKKYAMVYTDQRHQGNSHGHLKKTEVSVDLMVEDVRVLIKTLKFRYGNDIKIFLLGHSWGGMLGSSYMIKDNYQDDITGWIEVDGAHDLPLMTKSTFSMIDSIGQIQVSNGKNTNLWEETFNFISSLNKDDLSFDQTIELNSYAGKLENAMSEVHEKTDYNVSSFKRNFIGMDKFFAELFNQIQLPSNFWDELLQRSVTKQLNRINTPTLIQWGRYDFKVPPKLAYSAFEQINTNDKKLIIYEHSGHSPHRSEPDLFIEDLVNFIETHR